MNPTVSLMRLAFWLLGRERLVCRPIRLLELSISNLREPAGKQLPLV